MAAKKPNADKSQSAKMNTGESKTGPKGGKASSSLNAPANAGPKQHLDAVENSFQAHDPKHRQGHFEGTGEHPRTGTRGK